MNFRTTFELKEAEKLLNLGDRVIFLGSCFSENIGAKLQYFGFDALINPFGTLFHPLAIAELLDEQDRPLRILNREGLFFTYETHSELRAKSESELCEMFEQKQVLLRAYLQKSKLLVITFGSAWGYYLNGSIVANCHKMPARFFEKKLSALEEMHCHWRNVLRALKAKFPDLEVMFTVSPVRHTRDGMIENQRSKARLLELVHTLEASYFPAYELMLDDLRDYRFYEADMIHPNALAVDYIFEAFAKQRINESARTHFPKIQKFRQFEAHQIKPFDQDRFDQHQEEVELKRGLLRCQIPDLKI